MWQQFLDRYVNRKPVRLTPDQAVKSPYVKRLEQLEATVSDVVISRTLMNETMLKRFQPDVSELKKRVKELEERPMATTHAELQPVLQNFVQTLQQFTEQQAEVLATLTEKEAKLEEATKALEAQTNKYKLACDERDAALHREQVALQEGDKVKAQMEQLTQNLANLHTQAAQAINKPVAA